MGHSLSPRRTLWIVDDSAVDLKRARQALAPDHRIRVFSDGAAVLESLASGEMPDLLLLDWVMPEISGIEVCQYVRASSGRLPQMPIILLTSRHGSEEIIQAFASGANDYIVKPFIDEELKARVAAWLNSRQLLERAEQAEADVRTLLANAPDPIFAVDAQGKVSFANDEALRILSRRLVDVLGKPFSSLIPGVSLQHIAVGPNEPLLPLPDVQIDDKIFSPSIRILQSDNAAATTVALRDVTARRHAEARRLDFYSVIAHDLRTPITSIMLRLQLVFRGKYGLLPAGLIADLQKIEASLRSQLGLINDFLELAKLEGVGYKIDRDPVDLAELIRSTVDDFRPLLDKNKLHWETGTVDRAALVLGDRQRLTQVFANLLGNAIKFTPNQGIITTSVTVTGEQIEATVQDTGHGIARGELPTLFDRFTRAEKPAEGAPGTGLGLMIVREIVEAHGGVVGVESEPGVGSRFWIRLPRYQPQTEQRKAS